MRCGSKNQLKSIHLKRNAIIHDCTSIGMPLVLEAVRFNPNLLKLVFETQSQLQTTRSFFSCHTFPLRYLLPRNIIQFKLIHLYAIEINIIDNNWFYRIDQCPSHPFKDLIPLYTFIRALFFMIECTNLFRLNGKKVDIQLKEWNDRHNRQVSLINWQFLCGNFQWKKTVDKVRQASSDKKII